MRSAGLAVVSRRRALAVSLHAAPQIDPAEIQLQAAVNKATVEGDLKGAIFDFQKILNTAGVSRPVAARALLHLGQCHEKLGTAEARKSYERVLKDYADQGDVVRQARERLATLAKTAAPAPEDALQGRRVIGPSNHLRVAVSPDGRYVRCCSSQAPIGGPRRPDRPGPDDRRRRGGDAGVLAGQRGDCVRRGAGQRGPRAASREADGRRRSGALQARGCRRASRSSAGCPTGRTCS